MKITLGAYPEILVELFIVNEFLALLALRPQVLGYLALPRDLDYRIFRFSGKKRHLELDSPFRISYFVHRTSCQSNEVLYTNDEVRNLLFATQQFFSLVNSGCRVLRVGVGAYEVREGLRHRRSADHYLDFIEFELKPALIS